MKISLVGSDRASKKIVKKVIKNMGKKSAGKVSIKESDECLSYIGKWMEINKVNKVLLHICINDSEGDIESKGTVYTFENIRYQPCEGYYPSVLELIREDLFKETDENMSVEESYRNDKIIEVIESHLEIDDSSYMPLIGSERPREKWRKNKQGIYTEENSSEDEKVFQEVVFKDETDEPTHVFDEVENDVEIVRDKSVCSKKLDEPVAVAKEQLPNTHLSEEVLNELKLFNKEVQKMTALDRVLDIFPAEEEWMLQGQQLFLNQQFIENMLPEIHQAYHSGQEDYLKQAQGMINELEETFIKTDWEEQSKNKLSDYFKELENKKEESKRQHTESEVAIYEEKKEQLLSEEQTKIDETVNSIKKNYAIKREQLQLAAEERLEEFLNEQNKMLNELKEKELKEKLSEIKEQEFQKFQSRKNKVTVELLDKITELKQTTIEVINEKYGRIQHSLNEICPEWVKKHQISEEAKAIASEKEKQVKIEQLQLEIRQREADLKENEIQLEKEMKEKEYEIELSKIKLKEDQLEQRKKVQEEYIDAMLDPTVSSVREAFSSEMMLPKRSDMLHNVSTPIERHRDLSSSSSNKWKAAFFVMLGLLFVGGTITIMNQATQSKFIGEQTNQLEKGMEQVKLQFDMKLEDAQKNYDDRVSKTLEELEQVKLENTLEKLTDCIINYDSDKSLSIYEGLTDRQKKELTTVQKKAIKVFYEDLGQDNKADGVE